MLSQGIIVVALIYKGETFRCSDPESIAKKTQKFGINWSLGVALCPKLCFLFTLLLSIFKDQAE